MATITLRSPQFPPTTSVSILAAAAWKDAAAPSGSVIASGVVDAAGLLTVANAGLLDGDPYVAWALVAGEHRYVRVRTATTTYTGYGTATGTGNTTNLSPTLASVATTTGAFSVGQRIVGAGIPPGAKIKTIVGATFTLTDVATATATGVGLAADGGNSWQARLAARRAALNIN